MLIIICTYVLGIDELPMANLMMHNKSFTIYTSEHEIMKPGQKPHGDN